MSLNLIFQILLYIFCKIATLPEKKLPPPSFSATPLSKLRSCQALPPFWKFGKSFNPPLPPSRKGGGAHCARHKHELERLGKEVISKLTSAVTSLLEKSFAHRTSKLYKVIDKFVESIAKHSNYLQQNQQLVNNYQSLEDSQEITNCYLFLKHFKSSGLTSVILFTRYYGLTKAHFL